MKNVDTIIILAIIIISSLTSNSQIVADTFHIPSYPIPQIYYSNKAPELPDKVMNHRLKYFPQYFYDQDGLPNCGQASGIFNCMTYEFNRLYDRAADSLTIFAPSYSYNILCEGNGWYGVSTFDSWNLIMSQGNPTIDIYDEYKAFSTDSKDSGYRGQYRMNGYENYESSFKNRLSGYYSLDAANESDLKILMHYFNDHLDGSVYGGTAIFYSNTYFMYTGTTPVIEDSVLCYPNNKVKVISYMAGRPTHSMTLAGYYKNTTIDFNDDGLITDNIDINNDNVVDFHDNEKVLWIVINTYGESWPYSMFLFKYDLLAKVWNQQVFIPVPDIDYKPQLAFKVRMSHANRNSIKISAGIAKNQFAEYPEKVIDFPTFNFQGGSHTLTGLDSLPGAEILEFGIDITDILKHISEIDNEFARLFLIVENASGVEGSIDYCSIKSIYNHKEFEMVKDPQTIEAASVNVFSTILPITSQGTDTVLSIEDPGKQICFIGNEVNIKINAKGGSGVYLWQLLNTTEYFQEYTVEDYVIPEQLIYSDVDQIAISPGWQIAFGGRMWDSIYINANATISFIGNNTTPEVYPYPPLPNSFYCDYEIDAISGHYFVENITYAYEFDEEKITVWFNDIVETEIICIVTIYRTGKIGLTYPNTTFNSNYSAGIKTAMSAYYSGLRAEGISLHKNTVIYNPLNTNIAISVSKNGTINIPAMQNVGTNSFYIQLTDSNGHKATKRIELETIESVSIGSIFPNPMLDFATINLTNEESSPAILEIFNISGQLIKQQQSQVLAGTSNLDITALCYDLSPGIYQLKITLPKLNKVLRFVKS